MNDQKMFRIYGKHQTQKRFGPMDLSKGVQVVNLIYATRLTRELKDKFLDVDAKANPEWQFEARPI